jgi:hypothetical protein
MERVPKVTETRDHQRASRGPENDHERGSPPRRGIRFLDLIHPDSSYRLQAASYKRLEA